MTSVTGAAAGSGSRSTAVCDVKHIVLLWLSLRHSVQHELLTGSVNKSQVGSRGERERKEKREGDGETRRRGTWLPATSPAGLLNYTHTRAAKCIRTSAVYMIQNRIRSLTHTDTRVLWGWGGQMRQDVNGTYGK